MAITPNDMTLWQPPDGFKHPKFGMTEEEAADINTLKVRFMDNCVQIETRWFVLDEEDVKALADLLIDGIRRNCKS